MKTVFLLLISVLFTNIAKAEQSSDCLDFHVIHNAPIGFKSSTGKALGVHWDYLTAIEQVSGLCINKQLTPYQRIWHSISHGQHDGGIVFKSNSRSNLVEYAALIRTVKTVVIPVNGVEINRYEDLKHYTIGKTRGTHLSEQFDNDQSLTIVELNNYDQAAQMIKRGRLDAIAGSALVLSYQLNKYDALEKVNINNKFTLGEKEQWLQLSKKSKQVAKIPALKRAVEKLQKNGRFNQIMDKYYGPKWHKLNQ